MTWTTDSEKTRTYDSLSGCELIFISGGSDGSQSFEISGNNFKLFFTASLINEPITPRERAALGIPDAGVWRVYGNLTEDQRAIIAPALSATKMGHGFSPSNLPYFVRFEPHGELYGD